MDKNSTFKVANRRRDEDRRNATNKHASEWAQATWKKRQADNYTVEYEQPRLGCLGRLSLMVKRAGQYAVLACLVVVGYSWYSSGYSSLPLDNYNTQYGLLMVAGYGAVIGLVHGLFERH